MVSLRRWAIAVGSTCTALLLITACGGGEEEPAASEPAAQDTEADAEAAAQSAMDRAFADIPEDQRPLIESGEDGSFRYSGKTETGEKFDAQMGGDVRVPAGFFDELPLYPDAVPFSVMEVGDDTSLVTIDAGTDDASVYAFYKEQLAAGGWTLENDTNLAGGRVMNVTKNDRRAMIHIQSIEGGTRVGFMLGPIE